MPKQLKIFFNYFLVPALMLWLSVNIYHQITKQQNNTASWAQIKLAFNGPQTWKIILAVLLMFLNWAIEALKWQKLIAPLQKLSFWTAYKATFAGTSFAANTPNRMGEYFGRMIYVEEGKRLQSIPLTVTGSFSQLLVTLSFGCVGLFFFMSLVQQSVVQFSINSFWLKILLTGSIVVTVVSYLIYFKLNWIVKALGYIPFLKKYIFFFQKVDELSNVLLLKILMLSILRYLVFILQYILVMQAFGLQLFWLQNVYLLQVLFLVMSIIPSFVIMEAGIRGKVSIEIFMLVTTNNVAVLASGLFVWLLNLMAPALLGVLFLIGKKIFKK